MNNYICKHHDMIKGLPYSLYDRLSFEKINHLLNGRKLCRTATVVVLTLGYALSAAPHYLLGLFKRQLLN